jgi:Oxidoreductase family, NAD-binding Rossmann fold
MTKKGLTRREFLARTGSASAAVIASGMFGGALCSFDKAEGSRVRVAVVGLGQQGQIHLQVFSQMPGVEVVAVCDVSESALNRGAAFVESAGKPRPARCRDLRRILDDPTIDAVSIATPNHWHALMGIWTCQAGKDCYIESPCSHSFQEAQQLLATARKYERLVQHGTRGQFTESFLDEATVSGLGTIRRIKTVVFASAQPNFAAPKITNRRSLDLWVGPAPLDGIDERGSLDWRQYTPMHDGVLGFYALDSLHDNLRMLGRELPSKVSTLCGGRSLPSISSSRTALRMEFAAADCKDVAVVDVEVVPVSAASFKRRFGGAGSGNGKSFGVIEETTVETERGAFTNIRAYDPTDVSATLLTNFIGAVRSRNPQMLAAPIAEAYPSCAALHLANISLTLSRPVSFNTASESFEDDSRAQALLLGSHRAPYSLPKEV